MSNNPQPNTAQIRRFLNQAFDDPGLDAFCQDYFPAVFDRFSRGMRKDEKITLLLDHCRRTSNGFEALRQSASGEYEASDSRRDELKAIADAIEPSAKERIPTPLFQAMGSEGQSSQPQTVTTDIITWEKDGKEMVRVPAGEFLYGDDNQTISLSEFWIDKTPVTNAEYKRFLNANRNYPVPFDDKDKTRLYNWDREKRTFPRNKAHHPVVLVSWHDASAYAEWAGKRLPTEQEWEKAGRGTDGRKYSWGNEAPNSQLCNFGENERGTTLVGKYSLRGDSPYGCVDMTGNVWEWTASDYSPEEKVLRGGSWDNQEVKDIRVAACHVHNYPNNSGIVMGFRCAIDGVNKPEPTPKGEKMKDFFVSYNGKDKAWAEWIAWQLEEEGYTTVIQAWDFRPGGNFVLDMQKATAGAERTIAVLSENYLKAVYTQPEWAAAFKQDPTGEEKTLLPVRIEKGEVKGMLAPIVYIDLVGKPEVEARQTLLEGIKVGRMKPTTAPGFPGGGPVVSHTQPEKPSFPPEETTPATETSRSSTASTSTPLPRLKQIKLKALEERLETLTEQYEAANRQLNSTLAAADEVKIKRQLKDLEQEIQTVEDEITQLKVTD